MTRASEFAPQSHAKGGAPDTKENTVGIQSKRQPGEAGREDGRASLGFIEYGRNHLCEVEGCRNRAAWRRYCLDCEWETDALTDWAAKFAEQRVRREAWLRRFLAAFLFVLALGGALTFAFDLPLTWAWLLIEMGWALVIAALAAWWSSRGRR